jgi:hypothetical protein
VELARTMASILCAAMRTLARSMRARRSALVKGRGRGKWAIGGHDPPGSGRVLLE